ncbi:MAG: DEAD/DEAH box helicase [Reyranella sp.]|uniref:DEAD/DEAH box helicase n=1 Tax=Reyranella sp. TaxID=1929291 RepID=UPI001ACCF8DC|nr:DEAD/DEAH box helicase [Reyranella sp.]MBN9091121.1 DEAD/DEAH box helicase [Reyranella sp.]
MLTISYRADDGRAVIGWQPEDESGQWVDVVRRLAIDSTDDATQETAYSLSLPWWNFVAVRSEFSQICKAYGLSPPNGLAVSEEAVKLLQQSARASIGYNTATAIPTIEPTELTKRLEEKGFRRTLTENQLRNVGKLGGLPAGATFSVPGAGKTSEALATYFLRANVEDRLLVVAPKNAFAAWDEQLQECLKNDEVSFTRLRGGRDRISELLETAPSFMLITYQQLARVPKLIAGFCAKHRVHIFLDESHRIKSGTTKQTARAVLGLSHLTVGKLIMSGTPMPQSREDLIPQFAFLYPEVPANEDNVVALLKPVFVRTTKKQLDLPPITVSTVPLRMAPMQHELYKLMRSEVAREAATALTTTGRQRFRALGRSVARLLQLVSNPALISSGLASAHPDFLAAVLAEGDGPKLKYVLKRARSLTKQGHKVLIWSSFVRNVEYIAERLSDLGALYIHGGVDAGDEEDDDSREGKIRLFHDDPNVKVMVANPAAASEGVSLHRICHHALYLDRTFNAAHYLQSQDRIHRLGLPPEQPTYIEIVECEGSVDETVRYRLDFKVGQMAQALDDPSLHADPVILDPVDIEDYEEYSTGLQEADVRALLRDLSGE